MTSRGTKYWNSGSIPLIAPDLLGDIIATASDIAVVISEEGSVLSVLSNPGHRSFGRLDHWEGTNLRDFLTTESIPKFERKLATIQSGEAGPASVELNHTGTGTWEFPIRYSFHRIGPDGALLMLGRDLRPIAEMQQQLVRAQLALERDYETQREFDTRYRVLMEAMREAVVFVSVSTGRITDVNGRAAAMLGSTRDELIGTAFAQEFDGRRRNEFLENLTTAASSGAPKPVDLNARRVRKQFRVTPTLFRAAGERLLLCRLEAREDDAQDGDELVQDLTGLYREGIDSMVFTDADGIIRSANESFLNAVDAVEFGAVKGRSLAEFLVRGSVDLKVLTDNALRSGRMRLYATKLNGTFGTQVAVEVSATHLKDGTHPAFAFVLRDANRPEAAQPANVSNT
ncbi:MAG: transcriptional regulator PpsR, partial [Pseudomonadota bacterium]